MIVSTLIAASVAAQPAPAPQPTTAFASEKKMACCEKMSKGEGCSCCKGMGGEKKTGEDHSQHSKH